MTKNLMRMIGGVFVGCLLSTVPAHASLIFSVQPTTVNPLIPSTGNTLDVVLRNTGPTEFTISSFTFQISTADTDVTFTGATTATTVQPYIFNGDSFADNVTGSDLTPVGFGPAQTIGGSDLPFLGTGITLSAGGSVGLGHIFYNLSSTAVPGTFTVSFSGGTDFNSLSDGNFQSIPIDQFSSAEINASNVPEPGSLALLLSALGLLVVAGWKRKTVATE